MDGQLASNPTNPQGLPENEPRSVPSAWSPPPDVPSSPITLAGPPGVPMPPTDVNIRTMASDIKSMGESGGGAPLAKTISLSAPAKIGSPTASEGPKSKFFAWLILGAILVTTLFFAGYYLVFPLLSSTKEAQPATPTEKPVAEPKGLPAETAPAFFGHESYFAKRTDRVITIKLPVTPAGGAADAYHSQITAMTAALGGTASFFEANFQGVDGRPLSFAEFLTAIGADIFDKNFLSSVFDQDFTAFVYKDSNGLWPGFILKPKEGQNPILLQPKLLKLEKMSPSLANLFLSPPGDPLGFKDSQMSGQPVRVLNFSNTGFSLIYGWFYNNYLIVSTSQDGLKEALRRL